MSRSACRLAILAFCAVGLLPTAAAAAQWRVEGVSRQPPPLYPDELQPGQPYAVEIAPGAYVIRHPSHYRRGYRAVIRRAPRLSRRGPHANRGLIEELRRRDARRAARPAGRNRVEQTARKTRRLRNAGRRPDRVIHTRRIVREKPVVIETRRVVQDPPRVITRRHYVDNVPLPRRRFGRATGSVSRRAGNEDPRVIHAEAEITILGPDRMSIRLVRKNGQRLDIGARAPRRR